MAIRMRFVKCVICHGCTQQENILQPGVFVRKNCLLGRSNELRVGESSHHLRVKRAKKLVDSRENLSRFKFDESARELNSRPAPRSRQ